jgi:hypothetical protein
MIEITREDAQNILVMSEKVQISGKEAMAVAVLQSKLSKALEEEAPKEETPKKK